jgi:hypothetical protein
MSFLTPYTPPKTVSGITTTATQQQSVNLENQITAAKTTANKYRRLHTTLNNLIQESVTLGLAAPVPGYVRIPNTTEWAYQYAGSVVTIARAKEIANALYQKLITAVKLEKSLLAQQKANSGGGNPSPTDKKKTKKKKSVAKTLEYNCSYAKPAYFTGTQSFDSSEGKLDQLMYASNTPTQGITNAKQLWTTVNGSKGMIQTWLPKQQANYATSGTSLFGTGSGSSDGLGLTVANRQPYGFQFMYNPGTISMSYGGVLDVDPAFIASGKDEYANAAAYGQVGNSLIKFDLLLNRMYDMSYLTTGGKVKPKVASSTTINVSPQGFVDVITAQGNIADYWGGNLPTEADLKLIYEKGTMYDVEFLLKTVVGMELKTVLRGVTADLGIIGSIPIELHLGNSLRYVVTIQEINLNHVIFDDRMVPMFTTLSLVCSRIPDIDANVSNGSGGSGSNAASSSGQSNWDSLMSKMGNLPTYTAAGGGTTQIPPSPTF